MGLESFNYCFHTECFFLGFFYLAVSNEPDYMPSQQQKNTQQHAFKNAPSMSQEALEKAKQDQANREAGTAPVMTEGHAMNAEQHADMNMAQPTEKTEQGH